MEFEHIGERNAEIQEPYIDRLNRMAPNGLNPCLYHAYNPQPLTCDDCAKNVVEHWNDAVARLAKDPRHLERKLIGFTQEQLIAITKNQITRLEELEAKNASLTLQNEALRENLQNLQRMTNIQLMDQSFSYIAKALSQPTPDPDKISAVVKAAVEQRNLRQKIKDQAKVAVIFSKDKEGQAIVYPDDYFEACKKTEMLAEAYLNGTKEVG